jgi:hypothetical protein
MNRFETLIRDRRLQIGAVAGVAAIALCSFALAGADRPEGKAPEASAGRLPVEMQDGREAPPVPNGKLATLDPLQEVQPAKTSEPIDPQLQAMIDQDRRDQAAAQAEQRAFDARLRAEMADSYAPRPVDPTGDGRPHDRTYPTEPPAAQHGWTSNTEDAPGL